MHGANEQWGRGWYVLQIVDLDDLLTAADNLALSYKDARPEHVFILPTITYRHRISPSSSMATGYDLRKKDEKNYKDLCNFQLPRSKRIKKDPTLYELEIVEEDVYTNRVKVHYIGYDSDDDEWRDRADIVSFKPRHEPGKFNNDTDVCMVVVLIKFYYTGPFHLHSELAYRVKLALRPTTRSDPNVRIELPFDRFLFIGGLQQAGKLLKSSHGHSTYGIRSYSSLDLILGRQWHLRVFNKEKDFCYVILETVQFYLHRRQPAEDAVDPERSADGGYLLIFRFVRGDGVERNWEDIASID